MSQDVRFLFAYGTLMSTADTDLGRRERSYVQDRARLIGRGRFKGRLFDAGACPAAVTSPHSRRYVRGELWLLPSRSGRLLHLLDRYEGCSLGASEPYPYRRSIELIEHEFGWATPAWVYVWNLDTKGLPEIRSGEWHQRTTSSNIQPLRTIAPYSAAAVVSRRAA